ncbi:hypothetical protein L218DRAFT_951181 [Marasmius fiardii PR-910]|nr:hypothetical protein L218DRAFT_951181 [Marasmius fiardii PR-910]
MITVPHTSAGPLFQNLLLDPAHIPNLPFQNTRIDRILLSHSNPFETLDFLHDPSFIAEANREKRDEPDKWAARITAFNFLLENPIKRNNVQAVEKKDGSSGAMIGNRPESLKRKRAINGSDGSAPPHTQKLPGVKRLKLSDIELKDTEVRSIQPEALHKSPPLPFPFPFDDPYGFFEPDFSDIFNFDTNATLAELPPVHAGPCIPTIEPTPAYTPVETRPLPSACSVTPLPVTQPTPPKPKPRRVTELGSSTRTGISLPRSRLVSKSRGRHLAAPSPSVIPQPPIPHLTTHSPIPPATPTTSGAPPSVDNKRSYTDPQGSSVDAKSVYPTKSPSSIFEQAPFFIWEPPSRDDNNEGTYIPAELLTPSLPATGESSAGTSGTNSNLIRYPDPELQYATTTPARATTSSLSTSSSCVASTSSDGWTFFSADAMPRRRPKRGTPKECPLCGKFIVNVPDHQKKRVCIDARVKYAQEKGKGKEQAV